MPLQLIGVVLLIVLASILLRQKAYAKFPFFLSYILFSIAATAGLLSTLVNYELYFAIFWLTEAMDAILALLALHEAFHHVFAQDYRDWPWFWMVFPSSVIILSAIFVGDAVFHPPSQEPRIVAVILSFGTVVNCVKGGLFVMFALLAAILIGKSRPTLPFGIVFGFAISALGSGAAYWTRSIFVIKFNDLVKYGPPVAYVVAVLIWIGSCSLPVELENRQARQGELEEGLATMRQYLKALRLIAGNREERKS
jgi:hypothetical protein